jgi:hypothetical protein
MDCFYESLLFFLVKSVGSAFIIFVAIEFFKKLFINQCHKDATICLGLKKAFIENFYQFHRFKKFIDEINTIHKEGQGFLENIHGHPGFKKVKTGTDKKHLKKWMDTSDHMIRLNSPLLDLMKSEAISYSIYTNPRTLIEDDICNIENKIVFMRVMRSTMLDYIVSDIDKSQDIHQH